MRKTFLLAGFFVLLSVLVVSGCGGLSSTQVPPPPPPPVTFSNASLTGSYAVAVKGVNSDGPFTLMYILQADGNGAITRGRTFYNATKKLSFGGAAVNGTYNVAGDGRTTFNLNTDLLGPVTLDAVLLSNQHGLVVRFDSAATASGSIDKQDPSAFNPAAMAGTYVFNLQGMDLAGRPEASVGTFTVDRSSNITGGVKDTNDNGALTANAPILAGPASVFDVTGDGGGVFSYAAAPEGMRSFGMVAIDSNHIKFASNEGGLVRAGDLFRVSPESFSGSFVFTLHGVSGTSNAAFVAGGVIDTDGAGNVLSSSVEDINNRGLLSLKSPLSGNYSVSGSRVVLTLNDGSINLVAYPSMGGLQVLELDNLVIASGVALQQTGILSNATLNGSYGLILAGDSSSGKFVGVGQTTADGNGHLTGTFSLDDDGTLESNLVLNGTYAFGNNGRASGTLVTAAGSLNIIYYVVSDKQGLFIEVDGNRIAQGVLARQQ